jgi:hypothetical protein
MADSIACTNCGAAGLVYGTCQSTGALYFRPFNVPFLTFRTADIAIKAGMCKACGTLTFVGDSEKLRTLQAVSGQGKSLSVGDI